MLSCVVVIVVLLRVLAGRWLLAAGCWRVGSEHTE